MALMSDGDISRELSNRSGWDRQGDRIQRVYSFGDFVEAVDFTSAIVEPAEEYNHHPDLEVSWGEVVVNIMTHDEGGITEKDFQLADNIEQIYEEEFS
ncbi:MAG: 4a-hydroxytetrahydrobiopterin dehydratase [bacterium]